ncbi:pili/flagellar assembly PapD-like chaperone [Hoeflea marina]|uniref:Pili/flagellar assembly PapD-like chaperone n=1 Tax=Hoeflea marina TaxID=274592 RepID=A0A317PSG6_9HYPH|nr:fimbria/pilus periplasmic chaperone [Hoeflea marina]PWW04403.1 pili/flagellar assembly PapD-like chaperone [Hoeflea marina]
MTFTRLIAASLAACLIAGAAQAASLRVSPITLDLKMGASASTVRLWNEDRTATNVQVRVFRWTKVNGKDRLEPTTDVVASPPITKLAPGSENVIRVVRVSKKPVSGTEAYRLLIDELPDASKRVPGQVKVLVRHSIPVRFTE